MGELFLYFLGLFVGVMTAWVTIPSEYLDKLNKSCQSNGGVEKVRFVTIGSDKVFCKDGAEFKL